MLEMYNFDVGNVNFDTGNVSSIYKKKLQFSGEPQPRFELAPHSVTCAVDLYALSTELLGPMTKIGVLWSIIYLMHGE